MIIPVILSGGSGSRLWPLSRALYPKQLLPLCGENTMLQDTALRLKELPDVGPLYCVCNESHRFLVAEQLRETGVEMGGSFWSLRAAIPLQQPLLQLFSFSSSIPER